MRITIKPENRVLDTIAGESLMEALVLKEIPVQNICNGQGTCGKCKVRILAKTSKPTPIDFEHLTNQEIEMGYRLACNVKPEDGMEIEVSFIEDSQDRKEAALLTKHKTNLDSGLKKVFFHVSKPSLEDERGDWERTEAHLAKIMESDVINFSLSVLKKLPSVLRREEFAVTATLWGSQVLDIEAGDTTRLLFGVAVDIGTTSVAVSLVDLNTANVIKVVSVENGQTAYGADVISRISYARESRAKRLQMRDAVRKTINRLIQRLTEESGISANNIYKMTIAANTTMNHLFLGLDTSHLAVAPFVSVSNSSLELAASELSMEINREGRVLMFPNIGGFVGGDTVGAVIGTPELLTGGNHLLIDLGTNCELFLITTEEMIACSTAAGPAFEGAGIRQGMRAKSGAIEGATITEDGVKIKVIGSQKAIGICGSGLIEGIEQMKSAGIINKQGKIIDPEKASDLSAELRDRIRTGGKEGREFVLSFGREEGIDVSLTQRDIGELQLAKGAVCAGIKTLVRMAGISVEDLDSIVLAGTFATYLKAKSILEIGLVPNIKQEKIRAVGNAAHVGAMRALLDQAVFYDAIKLAKRVKHIELGGNKEFTGNFMRSMSLERIN
ncbi:ASKHA domain-containing protein [Desulfosporosinus sp. SB140]|uniref:ASKHA domain-containing protein n=1 Tax=Desulfosporosinus paludis TaxID=3115649 RepID=UPI00388E2723